MSDMPRSSEALNDDSHVGIRALLEEEQRLMICEINRLLKKRFYIEITTSTISQNLKGNGNERSDYTMDLTCNEK